MSTCWEQIHRKKPNRSKLCAVGQEHGGYEDRAAELVQFRESENAHKVVAILQSIKA